MWRFGSPLAISGNTSGVVEQFALHALPQGGFVATWESYAEEGIFLRHFNARGVPTAAANILVPAVNWFLPHARSAVLANGELLTVWQNAQEGEGLWAKRLDPRTGVEQDRVLLQEHFHQSLEDVQGLSDGGYGLKILTNPQQTGWMYFNWQPDYEVRLFDANDHPRAEPIKIQPFHPGWNLSFSLVPDSSGGFLAVWQESTPMGSWSNVNTGLAWQRFAASGLPAGPVIPLAETGWMNVSLPHGLVSLANGRVAALWSNMDDVDHARARFQLFAADGRKLGREGVLAGVNLSRWNPPRLCALADGGYAAIWEVADPNGNGGAIGGQRFNPRGRPVGERFLVNDVSTGHVFPEISITPMADGRFVVGWIDANRLTDSVNPSDPPRHWEIRGQILDGREAPIRLKGTARDDDFLGTPFADQIHGEAGHDRLAGGAGSDRLTGGSGDDRLIGGPGADRLIGGDGCDLFVFRSIDLRPGVRDTIVDFTSSVDRINLRAVDADVTQMGKQSFTLIPPPPGGGADLGGFTAPGQLRYDPRRGVLSGNINDQPDPDFQILLSNRPLLGAADLVL